MKSLVASAVAIAVCASIAASAPAIAQSGVPIAVHHCFVTEPKPMSKNAGGTQIDYTNVGTKTASVVVFTVGYRNAQEHFLRKVQDVGSFAPGQQVQHHFSLFSDVTYAGKQVTSCAPVMVKWSDGTKWVAH